MLTLLALGYTPLIPLSTPCASVRCGPVRAMADDGGELAMLQAMSDSFWKQARTATRSPHARAASSRLVVPNIASIGRATRWPQYLTLPLCLYSCASQKRARLQAELAQQLAELDEFEARERALQEGASGAPAPALAASSDVVALQAALEAERARNAALEEQLAKSAAAAEVNLQKVSSFW